MLMLQVEGRPEGITWTTCKDAMWQAPVAVCRTVQSKRDQDDYVDLRKGVGFVGVDGKQVSGVWVSEMKVEKKRRRVNKDCDKR